MTCRSIRNILLTAFALPSTCRSLAWRCASYVASRGLTTIFLGTLLVGTNATPTQAQTVVTTVASGPNPVAVAVNETTNMVYVADYALGTVTVINGATNTPTTIQTGGTNASMDLAVNATTNTVYALNEGTDVDNAPFGCVLTPGFVAVINGATNSVTKTIALPALAVQIAVNPVTNQIYVLTLSESCLGSGAGAANVSVIDGSTDTITATISVPSGAIWPIVFGERSLAVDTLRNVIYALDGWNGGGPNPVKADLSVIDGTTNTVKATIQVDYSDTELLFNQTTNTVYVLDEDANQLYVIDGATDTVTTTVPISPLFIYGAINPVTNEIYLHGGLGAEVVDGSTNTVTANFAFSYNGGFLVNTVTNKIWETSTPVAIIDGTNNTTTTVASTGTGGGYLGPGALNTTTNYAYMASSGSVLVINGAATGPAFTASPSPLAFGNQTQGTTSSAKTLTVTNSGTTGLSITMVTSGGTDMADFIIASDTCSDATVAAGKTCTVSVEFAPSTTAAESAMLSFADNAPGSPHVVDLTGTGVAPVATASKTALSASATSVVVGTSVTFTATVTPASGTPTPTGTVTFKDGSTTLGSGTLNSSGVATYTAASLAEGTHSVTASYGGDSRNLASTSTSVAVTVTAASSTTTLTSSAASAVVGSSITFTATVTGGSGAEKPTGTVTFKDGTTTLGTGTLNTSGVATYATSALAAGSHSVTANYAGDTNNAASASSSVAVTIWPGPPDFTMALSPDSGSFKAGTPATVTITVTSVNGFNAATSLACGTLPKNTVCDFSSASVTPGVSGTATSTLTIDTDKKPTATASAVGSGGTSPGNTPFQKPMLEAGTALAFILIPLFGARNRKVRRMLLTLSCLGVLAVLASAVSGCGGGPTTPKGTYSIQVTGTAGSSTHTATFSLTVQ